MNNFSETNMCFSRASEDSILYHFFFVFLTVCERFADIFTFVTRLGRRRHYSSAALEDGRFFYFLFTFSFTLIFSVIAFLEKSYVSNNLTRETKRLPMKHTGTRI